VDNLAQETHELRHISVQGVVQGVGFRPFVYRLATQEGLKGWVLNTTSGVEIEVEGRQSAIDRFLKALISDAPPLAHIEGVRAVSGPVNDYASFEIRESRQDAGYQLISPDIATCADCRRELFDPGDRRFRYPFTNCTNCGPRFTIISDIPYDRPNTTMARFRMCEACLHEYEDPLNRRFHAQPNACPECGPRVWLENEKGEKVAASDVIVEAVRLLKAGEILAIKGLGGFHLACDASNNEAVGLLRKRKDRLHKPFAVMMGTIDEIKAECVVDDAEEALLSSPHAPIVLLRRREVTQLAPGIAPHNKYLGVMLPYTPLHHVLLTEFGGPLVMTSGNISEEPIARDNDEARVRLVRLADYFLMHDRDIYSRYDDSVYTVSEAKAYPIRRARSCAPYPVGLPFKSQPMLAVGAQEKNTFCLTRDEYAFVSQHIGDLNTIETLEQFKSTVELYERLFRIEPRLIAHDLHPDYLSTRYALESYGTLPLMGVQHHHAHIASCMVENGTIERVIGVAFDGSGFGPDGTVWGGEFLLADLCGFTRVGRIQPLPLPGGELAIRRPYRIAIAYLFALFGSLPHLPFLDAVSDEERTMILQQVQTGVNTPMTSSCGRLFDAVSAIVGIRSTITFEGQAAIELEMSSEEKAPFQPYPYGLDQEHGLWEVRVRPLIESVLEDMRTHVPLGVIGSRFHDTIALIIQDVASRIARETGIRRVALSGGVFQNRLLLNRILPLLRESSLDPLLQRQVPCNDGGISLGQAAIAHNRIQGKG
jgi:hydrogenase maturation protein HypF